MAKTKICFACNEDGVGPSAFAYYVVRAMAEAWQSSNHNANLEIWVLVSNENTYDYNERIYSNLRDIVHLPDKSERANVNSSIRLIKKKGEVHVPETLELWQEYVQRRQPYARNIQQYLQGCCIAIDIGVPLFARCAKKLGVPNITLFDHSWACTLRGICSREAEYTENPRPTDEHRELAEQIALEVENDERCTSEVILFDRYIAPPEFRWHWSRLGFTPTILKGVLGSRQNPNTALEILNNLLCELGQQPVSAGKKLVLISPGGTPVWNEILHKLTNEYVTTPRDKYIPVLSLADPNVVSREDKERITLSNAIRWFGVVKGSTQQVIMPAFDLVVTRAGGGTVNDCLASETPFACVEERQWQVKLIERECRALNLIPAFREASLDEFKEHPSQCVDRFFQDTPCNKSGISAGVEKDIAAFILSWCRLRG